MILTQSSAQFYLKIPYTNYTSKSNKMLSNKAEVGYNIGMDKIDVAGLKIDALTKKELMDEITRRANTNQKTFITTPYSEFLYHALEDPELMKLLNGADIAAPDGVGILWAAKYLQIPLSNFTFIHDRMNVKYYLKILQALWQMRYSLLAIIFYPRWIKSVLPEKISGSNLIWDLAKLAAENGWSIYLLGGFGDTPKLVAEKLKTYLLTTYNLQLKIAGYSNKNPGDPTVIEDIKKAAPDFLFVAYGPFKQERWIAANLQNLPVKLAIGLGGTFDYIAGKQPESPQFLRRIGLEWLWRLFTQPRRIKRIINATFGLCQYCLRYKVFSGLPLRTNAAVIILNQENKILVCERSPKNFYVDIINTQEALKRKSYWQFPQGGIDDREDLAQAAKREAMEETGIKSLELIKISNRTNAYIWNNALRGLWKNRNHPNIGQIQRAVYFRFFGTNDEIKIDGREFINYQWVAAAELGKIIHPERINLVKIVQEDLKNLA